MLLLLSLFLPCHPSFLTLHVGERSRLGLFTALTPWALEPCEGRDPTLRVHMKYSQRGLAAASPLDLPLAS